LLRGLLRPKAGATGDGAEWMLPKGCGRGSLDSSGVCKTNTASWNDEGELLSCKATLKNADPRRSLSLGVQSVTGDQVANQIKVLG